MSDNSSFVLKHNPLGIHSQDGTELVLAKTPRQAPKAMHFDDKKVMNKAMKASYSYENDQGSLYDSAPNVMNLTDLGISQPIESKPATCEMSQSRQSRINVDQNQLSTSTSPIDSSGNLGSNLNSLHLDFGGDFKIGGLGRQNTITARRMPPSESTSDIPDLKTKTGPSANPLLIQRLRSIRRKMSPGDVPFASDDEEDHLDGSLSDDVLKMIAFNPDSPWLGFDEGLSDLEQDENYDTYQESGNASVEEEKRSTHNLIYSGDSPERLNPFYMAKERASTEDPSVSTSTLASHVTPEPNHDNQQNLHSPVDFQKQICTGSSPAHDEAGVAVETPISQVIPHTPTMEETDPVKEDDRGRLFLQINKISDMRGLPIDTGRNPKFTLSLDNGLQTVTTDPLPLPAPGLNGHLTAKIGQEFELTVAKDLELVLTVAVSMDALQPPPKASIPRPIARHKPSDSVSSSVGSTSTGGSPIKSMKNLLLRSPKKKQQQQRFQEQEQEQRLLKLQEEEEKKGRLQYERDLQDFYRRSDLWRGVTGSHGEYCRGYVFESHYEKEIYGVAKSFGIPLYNEWDKASSDGVPKPVCELQVTMMYVPKLYASEAIPMSMRDCQKAIEVAKNKVIQSREGFLTQQGGDCGSMWRRRWFTLNDVQLISHHEATRKRRSVIHLDKALSVKDTLSDDLWCIYEDRSFQISFKDGQDISFYADTVEARDDWLKALKDTIASSSGKHRSWTDLVIQATAHTTSGR